jgi:hypothetical protein
MCTLGPIGALFHLQKCRNVASTVDKSGSLPHVRMTRGNNCFSPSREPFTEYTHFWKWTVMQFAWDDGSIGDIWTGQCMDSLILCTDFLPCHLRRFFCSHDIFVIDLLLDAEVKYGEVYAS